METVWTTVAVFPRGARFRINTRSTPTGRVSRCLAGTDDKPEYRNEETNLRISVWVFAIEPRRAFVANEGARAPGAHVLIEHQLPSPPGAETASATVWGSSEVPAKGGQASIRALGEFSHPHLFGEMLSEPSHGVGDLPGRAGVAHEIPELPRVGSRQQANDDLLRNQRGKLRDHGRLFERRNEAVQGVEKRGTAVARVMWYETGRSIVVRRGRRTNPCRRAATGQAAGALHDSLLSWTVRAVAGSRRDSLNGARPQRAESRSVIDEKRILRGRGGSPSRWRVSRETGRYRHLRDIANTPRLRGGSQDLFHFDMTFLSGPCERRRPRRAGLI